MFAKSMIGALALLSCGQALSQSRAPATAYPPRDAIFEERVCGEFLTALSIEGLRSLKKLERAKAESRADKIKEVGRDSGVLIFHSTNMSKEGKEAARAQSRDMEKRLDSVQIAGKAKGCMSMANSLVAKGAVSASDVAAIDAQFKTMSAMIK